MYLALDHRCLVKQMLERCGAWTDAVIPGVVCCARMCRVTQIYLSVECLTTNGARILGNPLFETGR